MENIMSSAESLGTVAEEAIQLARNEIMEFGSPDMEIFDISLDHGVRLASKLQANVNLVKIGVSMMDLKLGQSIKEGRVGEHIKMSVDAANDFLADKDIDASDKEVIINSIEAHHGGVEFNSIESEICTNADCYRFLHPRGIFVVFNIFKSRIKDTQKSLVMLDEKMEEKMNLMTLDVVRKELEPIYKDFKKNIYLAIDNK
jgi:hypothetical protein